MKAVIHAVTVEFSWTLTQMMRDAESFAMLREGHGTKDAMKDALVRIFANHS